MPRPGRCWTACASVCSSVKGGSASIVVLWWGLIKMWKCLAEQLARHVFRAAHCPSCWVWPGSLLRGHGRNYKSFPQFPLYSRAVLAYGKGAHLEWVAPRPTASVSPTVLLKMQNLRLLPLLLPAESGTLGWDTPFYVFTRSLGDLRTATSEPQRSDS